MNFFNGIDNQAFTDERVVASRWDYFSMLFFMELRRVFSKLRTEVYWGLDLWSVLFVSSLGRFYLLG